MAKVTLDSVRSGSVHLPGMFLMFRFLSQLTREWKGGQKEEILFKSAFVSLMFAWRFYIKRDDINVKKRNKFAPLLGLPLGDTVIHCQSPCYFQGRPIYFWNNSPLLGCNILFIIIKFCSWLITCSRPSIIKHMW